MTVTMDHKNKRKASWDSKVSSSVLLTVACLNFLLSSHGTILVFRHSFRRDRAIVFSSWAYNTEWIILCLTPISYSFAVCSASKKIATVCVFILTRWRFSWQ